jgi:hypothetical protein
MNPSPLANNDNDSLFTTATVVDHRVAVVAVVAVATTDAPSRTTTTKPTVSHADYHFAQ